MLAAGKFGAGVVFDNIAVAGGVGNKVRQVSVFILLKLGNAAVRKQYTLVSNLTASPVQHEFDELEARLVEAPAARLLPRQAPSSGSKRHTGGSWRRPILAGKSSIAIRGYSPGSVCLSSLNNS